MANCFFLIRSSVDGYKIIKTAYSLRVGDFGFSMSPRDVYYQFYKNAPIVTLGYYIHVQLFQIFIQSIAAIDVTSVPLGRVNSINAIDVKRCKLMLQ